MLEQGVEVFPEWMTPDEIKGELPHEARIKHLDMIYLDSVRASTFIRVTVKGSLAAHSPIIRRNLPVSFVLFRRQTAGMGSVPAYEQSVCVCPGILSGTNAPKVP